jgi:hypothetical protein
MPDPTTTFRLCCARCGNGNRFSVLYDTYVAYGAAMRDGRLVGDAATYEPRGVDGDFAEIHCGECGEWIATRDEMPDPVEEWA